MDVNERILQRFVLVTVYFIDIPSLALITFLAMKPDPFYSEFGKLVRAHRKRLGLTQDQLSERVGLSRTSITNIELGRQKILLHHLLLLAESLEISPDLLLPSGSGAEVERHIDEKLPRHLTDPEKAWVRRIMVPPPKKGGTSHGKSEG